MKYGLQVVFALYSIIGCTRIVSSEVIVADGSKVIETSLNPSKAIDLETSDPSQVVCFDDYLLIRDVRSDQGMLAIHKLSESKTRHLYKLGRGPGEMVGFYDVSISLDNRKVYLFDVAMRKILVADVDTLFLSQDILSITREISLSGMPSFLSVTSGPSGIIYGTGVFERARIIGVNEHAEVLKEVVYSPDGASGGSNMVLNQAFMGRIAYEPIRNMLVLACRYSCQLEYYDVSADRSVIIRGPEDSFPMYDVVNGVVARKAEEKLGYVCVHADESYVYALYSGKCHDDPDPVCSSDIRVFDWDGQYVRRYVLNQDIYSFDVDDSNKILYALSKEGEILVYDLPV